MTSSIVADYIKTQLLPGIGIENDEVARAKIYGIITLIDTRRPHFASLLANRDARETFDVDYELGSFEAPLPAIANTDAAIDELRLALLEAMFSLHEEYADYLQQQRSRQCGVSLDFVSRELKPFRYEIDRCASSDDASTKVVVVLEQKLVQNPEDLGNTVWDGAQFLCRQLQLNPALVVGKNVLEVGAGAGLCGIVASVFGARSVVLTDMDAVTDLLHRNVDSNRHLAQSDSSSLDVRVLDWNKRPLPSLSSDAFDVILAADCIYTHAPLKEFVAILSHYSTPNDTKILLTCEEHEPESLRRFLEFASSEFDVSLRIKKTDDQRVNYFELIRKAHKQ